jgi:hypothetical protein
VVVVILWKEQYCSSTQGNFDCVKEDGIEELHVVVLYCVDVVLVRGQRHNHNEKLSLVTYHHYCFPSKWC